MKDQIIASMKAQGQESSIPIIEGRHAVVVKYCENKGWDMNDLSFDKILEIRKTDAWKNGDVEALA